MSVKQPYYLQAQDPLKLFEQSLQPPVMQQQPLEKKMKPFPMEPYNQNPSEVKVPEYYWDSSYGMTDNRVMAQQSSMERRGKRQGVFRSEQDAVSRMTFEVRSMPRVLFLATRGISLFQECPVGPRRSMRAYLDCPECQYLGFQHKVMNSPF